MTAPAGRRQPELAAPCRCALCLALLRAIENAERNERARRGTLAVMDGGRVAAR